VSIQEAASLPLRVHGFVILQVCMRQYFELLIAQFAAIGEAVFGSEEQIVRLWKAVLPFVIIIFGSLLMATVILAWSVLMIQILGLSK
jgi:hypothetical protein